MIQRSSIQLTLGDFNLSSFALQLSKLHARIVELSGGLMHLPMVRNLKLPCKVGFMISIYTLHQLGNWIGTFI